MVQNNLVLNTFCISVVFVFLLCSFQKAASQSPDCGEYYFLLGQLYWDMGEETRNDRNKAHTHLLKASAVIIKGFVYMVGKVESGAHGSVFEKLHLPTN